MKICKKQYSAYDEMNNVIIDITDDIINALNNILIGIYLFGSLFYGDFNYDVSDCVRDLFQEWEPKTHDLEWLNNCHYQSYLILNLCRILYTVYNGQVGSKKVSAEWVKTQIAHSWTKLITEAEEWKYVMEMPYRDETIRFIEFTMNKIKCSNIYQEIKSEIISD